MATIFRHGRRAIQPDITELLKFRFVLEGASRPCSPWNVLRQLIEYVMDLVLLGAFTSAKRYRVFQPLEAMVLLNLLSAGSCSVMISMPAVVRVLLLIRLCWHVGNLLTFCCQITRLFFC